MIEIKGDYMIDDTVTAAKEKYALEMGFVNKMEYRLMEASIIGNGQILTWKQMIYKLYCFDYIDVKIVDPQFDMS